MGAIFGIAGSYTEEDILRMHTALRNRGTADPVIHRFDGGFIGCIPHPSQTGTSLITHDSGAMVVDGYFDRRTSPESFFTEATDSGSLVAGLYACAKFLKNSGSLHLFRDSSGARSLYHAQDRNRCIFASAPRAILNLAGFSRRLNPEGVSLYLTMICPPDPVTIFDSIQMLRPGFSLKWDGAATRIQRFRKPLPPAGSGTSDITRILSGLRSALEQAVSDAVPSDPENTGFFLSGGTDTGSIVALASRAGVDPVNTYTIGYEGSGAGYEDYNEFHYAKLIADHYGTNHHECIISPATVLDALPGIIAGLDQPSGDAINTYLVAATLPDHLHTVLTGTGGDEIFIGSHWFKQQARLQTMNRKWLRLPGPIRQALLAGSTLAGGSIRRRIHRLDALGKGVPAQYRHFKFLFDGSALEHLLTFDYQLRPGKGFSAAAIIDLYDETHRDDDEVNRMESLLFQHEVSNLQLRDVDSMCMAHGIEARSPLVDSRILDVLDSVPGSVKAPGGSLRHLMFQALDDCLLTETRTRRKMSFIVPMDLWARRELRPAIELLLSSEIVKKRGILNPDVVRNEMNAFFVTGRERHPFKVWNLALLELWCRFHIDAPVGSVPPDTLDDLL